MAKFTINTTYTNRATASVSVSRVSVHAQSGVPPPPALPPEIEPLERSKRHQGPSYAALDLREQYAMQERLTAPAQGSSDRITPYRWNVVSGGARVYGDRSGLGFENSFEVAAGTATLGGGLGLGHSLALYGGTQTEQGGNFGQMFTNGSAIGGGWAHNVTTPWGTSSIGGIDGMVYSRGELAVVLDSGNWVLLEQRRTRGLSPQFLLALTGSMLGVGAHGGPVFYDTAMRRVWLTRDEASRVLQGADHGIFTRWYRRAEALGLRAPPIAYVSPKESLTQLGTGERVSWSGQSIAAGGVAVALAGVLFGHYRTMGRESEITLERVAANRVHATLIPQARTTSKAWAINIPILGEWHRVEVRGSQERETYALELSDAQRQQPFKKLSKTLMKSGHTRLSVLCERQQLSWQRATGGGFPAPSWLPFVNIAGVWQDMRVTEEQHEAQAPSSTVRTWRLTRTRETQWLHHGTRHQHIFAALRQEQRATGTSWKFVDLTLGAEFTYDRFTRYWQPRLLRKLKQQFLGPWQELGSYTSADNAPYRVTMQRALDIEDLRRLGDMPVWAIENVSRAVNGDAATLRTMCAHLAYHAGAATASPMAAQAQANVVRRYLGDVGLTGLGAVHLLLGGELKQHWRIDVAHGAVQNAAQRATEISVKYALPPRAGDKAYSLREIAVCKRALEQAGLGLRGDPILQTLAPQQARVQEETLHAAQVRVGEINLHLD